MIGYNAKKFHDAHVLDNHRNVGNQKCKPVIVANRLQYVYDVYTQTVGSERVKHIFWMLKRTVSIGLFF